MRLLDRLIREPRYLKTERVERERAIARSADRERKLWERAVEDREAALWGAAYDYETKNGRRDYGRR
jgi:hypothetical protein